MRRSRTGATARSVLALLAAAFLALPAHAQLPGFPSPFPDPLRASTPATPAAAQAETRERVVERLRRQIAEVEAARKSASPPPAGITPEDVTDLEDARTALVHANQVQLAMLEQIDKARAGREAAEAAQRDWRGFDDKPPYSILRVDDLRDAADTVRQRVLATERAIAHLKSEGERYANDIRAAEETLRRVQESVDRAETPEARERAAWQRDLMRMRLRVLASRAASTQFLLQFQGEEAGTRRAELALLERQLETAAPSAVFTEADLAKARARIAARESGLRAERGELSNRLAQREKDLAEADQALTAVRDRPAPGDELKVAEARRRAAETWVATLRTERELLDGLVQLNEDLARNWESRRTAQVAEDAESRRLAAERLRASAARLARWRGYLDNLIDTQRGRLADATTAVVRADAMPAVARYDQEVGTALRRGLATFERVQSALAETQRTVDRWAADASGEGGTRRSYAERLADNWATVKAWARDIWNFEIFAVEDTTLVDGHEVKTSRGVTIGKSIGALLVFVVGYGLSAALARRVERGLVARGFDARRVRNTRRWALIAVAGVLALFTLNVARIPLTVFAFFGGALAIGVGFGTQTIIRNFISGLIMLAERRIQIGDIIEVDGVTGTVTSVDLRSSTVLGFDGVETSVPNAMLLENKVTNWTHSDKRVRRVIKVGVAYGSPLRDVADILGECAERHGVVLKDPEPQVVFEDFGSDALVFALYFWVELRPGVSAMQVASDLRFMIARRFAEAGIVVAFPQRDVHLDASQPLRVEVLNPPAGERAAGRESVEEAPLRRAAAG